MTRDRGGGIHMQGGGDFRIRNLHLSFDRTTGDLVDSSMITELRAYSFRSWLEIAEQASDDAESARRDAVAADLGDNVTFNAALEREFRGSMIAVAAAAFAIDSFYASVLEHAPETKVKAKGRDAEIFETLKRAFALSAAQQAALREPLRMVFRLRDEAVHPPASWVAPALHPAFNLGMEPRFVRYRAENAVNAQLLARKLVEICLAKPRPKYAALVEWGEGVRDTIPEPPPVPAWADATNPGS